MSIRHVSTSIKGLEAMSDYRLKKMAPCIEVEGAPLRTAAEVRRILKEMQADGMEYIPADGCDHYDSKGLCLGHEKEDLRR